MLTFSGNFFEIGRQQGKIYRENGMSFKGVKINPELFRDQLKIYKRYYPEMLEEIEGMAAAGFNHDKAVYRFICGEILWFTRKFGLKKACTIFGVKSDNGVFVGRNYDWIPATEKIFKAYRVANPQRNSFLGLTDMAVGAEAKPSNAFYNADDAINDKGLFIGLTFAYSRNWSYGLSTIHMTKLIAETCSTVGEALKMFETVPLCCPKNFFIADRRGGMAVVEHTSKKFKIIRPRNGVLIQTNHYTDPELAAEDAVLINNPVHNTFLRYRETQKKIILKKESFSFQDVIKILGDRKSPVCQSRPIRTIWSLALDMKKRKYKLYWNLFGKRKESVLKV